MITSYDSIPTVRRLSRVSLPGFWRLFMPICFNFATTLACYSRCRLLVSVIPETLAVTDVNVEPEIGVDSVKDLLSTPFGVGFDGLLERLSQHKGLFDIDLRAGRHTSLEVFLKRVSRDLEDREEFMQENEVRQHLEDEKETRDSKGSHQISFV